jgi:alpha-N-arabinofuranosidase
MAELAPKLPPVCAPAVPRSLKAAANPGNRMKSFLLNIMLLTAAWAARSQSSAPVADIDASRLGPPISPYVYGQFLEHIGGLVYGSLWCEMLDDRKFYYPVMTAPAEDPGSRGGPGPFGPGRRRDSGPGRWNPIGPVDSVVMDTNRPFVGDHTPRIQLAGDEPRGIRQTGLHFVKGSNYVGRIQLAGDSGARVTLSVVWGTNADAPRQEIWHGKPGADYRKEQFSFAARDSGVAQFEIRGTGTGAFHVGAVSLMPADNVEGWKPDGIAALKSLRSGVYRFPGGNYVSAFEWREAIGDPDRRPPVYDPVWRAVQPNDIGTDEFLAMCRLLGVEPYISVNAGTGDAWSAAEYVEYANGDTSTPMGKQRAANGHPAPYHVKFWGIGNEMWGISYQYGAMKLEQFEYKHNQFARAMRKVDPGIQLIASGAMPDTMTGSRESLSLGTNLIPAYLSPADWTGGMLQHCFDNFDLISEHYYNYGNTHLSLAEGRQVPNDPNEPITDWMRRPANHVRLKYEEYREYEKLLPQLAAHPKPMAIDEWAYMGGKYPVYPSYAWVFHEMFRHSDIIQMGAYTFATALLARDGTNVSLNANGLVFKIYRDHFGSIPVAVSGNSPQPKPTDPPGGEQPAVNAGSDTFPVDVVAAWTGDHRSLTVAVLNPTDADQPLRLHITGAGLSGKGKLWRLASTEDNGRNPRISSSPVDLIPDSLTLPPFSVSIYELPVN